MVLIHPNQLQTQEKYLNFQEELVYSEYLKGEYAFNNYASSLPQTCFFYESSQLLENAINSIRKYTRMEINKLLEIGL